MSRWYVENWLKVQVIWYVNLMYDVLTSEIFLFGFFPLIFQISFAFFCFFLFNSLFQNRFPIKYFWTPQKRANHIHVELYRTDSIAHLIVFNAYDCNLVKLLEFKHSMNRNTHDKTWNQMRHPNEKGAMLLKVIPTFKNTSFLLFFNSNKKKLDLSQVL